jgi:hypothetical protein
MQHIALPTVLPQETQLQMESTVAAPTKDERKAGENLPNPGLNPLINPILGKNLGRWAHVYYSTPPEKREQAILELLRELESAPQPRQEVKPPAATEKNNKVQTETQVEALCCPACLHKTGAHQRFCGLCGFALTAGKSSDPAQQLAAPAPPPSPPPIQRKVADWQWARDKNLAESGTAHENSQSWRYVAFVLIIFTAIGSSWLWRMHSQTAEQQTASRIDRRGAAIPEQVTRQLRSNVATGERETGKIAPAQSASDSSKRPAKPAAGKPFGCSEDHLGNCTVHELYSRTMILAETIDAVFIDYDRRVTRLRMNVKAHESDSAKQKQERLRRGNYSAQLWENLRLRSYVGNEKNDALRYRTELLRRAVGAGLESRRSLDAYKNPRLCLDLHYVAEDLRRLAAKLLRPEIPTSESTSRVKSNSLSR